jgi:XTP/dITP diphosphohydrolase
MHDIIFATNNANKVAEIRSVLGDRFEIKSLLEAGIHVDIPEPHDTLEKNATEKSNFIFQLTRQDCFSEDTGLEVEALNGEPGVRSARYAGVDSNAEKNIDKLLLNLSGQHNRAAQFKTVISLILNGKEFQFTGICKGKIALEKSGSMGFGYDAVFIPTGAQETFAQMTMDQKNQFSHRKKAAHLFIDFLKNHHGQD